MFGLLWFRSYVHYTFRSFEAWLRPCLVLGHIRRQGDLMRPLYIP